SNAREAYDRSPQIPARPGLRERSRRPSPRQKLEAPDPRPPAAPGGTCPPPLQSGAGGQVPHDPGDAAEQLPALRAAHRATTRQTGAEAPARRARRPRPNRLEAGAVPRNGGLRGSLDGTEQALPPP